MKMIFTTLAFLVFTFGSTMAQSNEMDSSKVSMRQVFKWIHNYIVDDNAKSPFGSIAKMVVSKMPCMDPSEIIMNRYSMMCGYSNCEMDAPKCMQALKLSSMDMCSIQKTCLPEAIEAFPQSKEAFFDCVFMQMMEKLNVSYAPGSTMQDNAPMVVEALVSNSELSEDAKADVVAAVGNKCEIPPRGSCITDHMRFKMCLMNVCVESMYDSAN